MCWALLVFTCFFRSISSFTEDRISFWSEQSTDSRTPEPDFSRSIHRLVLFEPLTCSTLGSWHRKINRNKFSGVFFSSLNEVRRKLSGQSSWELSDLKLVRFDFAHSVLKSKIKIIKSLTVNHWGEKNLKKFKVSSELNKNNLELPAIKAILVKNWLIGLVNFELPCSLCQYLASVFFRIQLTLAETLA